MYLQNRTAVVVVRMRDFIMNVMDILSVMIR